MSQGRPRNGIGAGVLHRISTFVDASRVVSRFSTLHQGYYDFWIRNDCAQHAVSELSTKVSAEAELVAVTDVLA